MTRFVITLHVGFAGGLASMNGPKTKATKEADDTPLRLGNFSMSLTVKDLNASRAFYEKLGFRPFGKTASKNMVIMQNETCTIGLFHGMFDKNSLTFNPGSTPERETMKDFQDVRELQHVLKSRGVAVKNEIDETTDGPAGFEITDPDGYPILIDQYVSKPKR